MGFGDTSAKDKKAAAAKAKDEAAKQAAEDESWQENDKGGAVKKAARAADAAAKADAKLAAKAELKILIVPLVCAILAFLPGGQFLVAVAVGVPLLCVIILAWPMCVFDPDPYQNVGFVEFTINGVTMTFGNYLWPLINFLFAAMKPNWRVEYGKWFVDQTDDDKSVATKGANAKMYYSYSTCKEKLQQIDSKISSGTWQRESQLALKYFNNVSWPEAGRMILGLTNEDHAFVRPYLAEMFDSSRWTSESLRSQFRKLFASITTLDHNNTNNHRTTFEPILPCYAKNIVTQWTLKVLHKALDIDLTDSDAMEMAALQTLSLGAAAPTGRACSSFLLYALFTKPTLVGRAKFMEMYRPAIKKRFPDGEWTDKKLDLLSSSFLDAMMFAGGRSVPLAIDLVMGYILTINKPECIRNVDFTKEDNVRSLLMETMRYHPVVTTLPYWAKSSDTATGQGKWEHEAVCIDRALADPSVFDDPDTFKLNRPGQKGTEDHATSNSIAWAEFACVAGKNGHPNSHNCPAKDLSMNLVLAFVKEYQSAGPWKVEDDNITFNYYGTEKGFKCTKVTA